MWDKIKLDATSLGDLFNETSRILKEDKRKNFRALCLNTDLNKEILKDVFRKRYDVNEQGEFLELFTTYHRYGEEREIHIYAYFLEDMETLIIFTLASSNEVSRTIDKVVESTEGIYYLWIPPSILESIQENILSIEGCNLVYFSYKNYGETKRGMEEGKPGGEHEGEEALSKLEKWKKEEKIKPTSLEFEIPTKGNIKVNNTGEFVFLNKKDIYSFAENIQFFYDDVIRMAVNETSEMNREIKSSRLYVIKEDDREKIEEKELQIELEEPLAYQDEDRFLQEMEKADFVPFDYNSYEGSLIMEGNIVDDSNGGIISLSSDGETFFLLPKFETKFDSLLRFYRFLIERIDPNAKIVRRDE